MDPQLAELRTPSLSPSLHQPTAEANRWDVGNRIRKVKCDEAKPYCLRCTNTGRKCDGYPNRAQPSLALVRDPGHKVPTLSVLDGRALDFFEVVAGPALSRDIDSKFWTELVLQLGHREPVVRDALVAISSLYEGLNNEPKSRLPHPKNDFAVAKYNSSIHQLSSTHDEATVLLTCVLYVCIEFLLGNKQTAIDHCRHGVYIYNKVASGSLPPWIESYLSPLLQRLSMFPYFFGGSVSNFPKIYDFQKIVPTTISSLSDAHQMIDALKVRSIRFIRSGDDFRLGKSRHLPYPIDQWQVQAEILKCLDDWQAMFSAFKQTFPDPHNTHLAMIEMKYHCAHIWVSSCLVADDIGYDDHLHGFQRIVELARGVDLRQQVSQKEKNPSKFTFEMGFLPLLYFVVIKCREFVTRVQALNLMKELAVARESLWDIQVAFRTGKKLIEIEHKLKFTDVSIPSYVATPESHTHTFPPKYTRVWDSLINPTVEFKNDADGKEIAYRRVWFMRRTEEKELDILHDIIVGCSI
jgi:hypothetical protein